MLADATWPESSLCCGSWRGDSGRSRPRPLRCYGQRRPHALIVGPSGSGKTWSLVLPTLLKTWFRSVVVWDVKGELYERTAGARAHFSHVIRLAPAAHGSARYNPLDAVRRGDHAVADAANIAGLMAPDPDDGGDKVWDVRAKDYFAAAILWTLAFAEDREKNLRGVASMLTKGRSFAEAMAENKHPDPEIARFISESAATIINNESEKFVWSVLGTLDGYMVHYREPILAANTETSDFCASDLMTGEWPVSLYICMPVPEKERLQPFLRTLVGQLLADLQFAEDHDRDGALKRHPLLWCLDETHDLGALGAIPRSLSRMRSFGMRALLGCQTTAQLRHLCGMEQDVLNNCRLLVTRQNALHDARAISGMLGDALERRESSSRSGDSTSLRSGYSRSESDQWRPLMQPSEILRMADDRLLVFGEDKPIMAWRTDPAWWQADVVPGPAPHRPNLPVAHPWRGVRYPTVTPEDIKHRKEEEKKAEAAPKPVRRRSPPPEPPPAEPASKRRI